MSLEVGDSIPVDSPEGSGKAPKPLAFSKARAFRRPNHRPAGWQATLSFVGWWLAPLPVIYLALVFFWPACALLSLVHVGLMSRRRGWRRGLACLALSPLVFLPLLSAAQGLVDYADGTARARGHGMRDTRGRLDPLTRTYVDSSGCVVFGYEPFVEEPYNHAVGLMVRCFGALRGHHDGAYPSRDEAFAALAGGRDATWDVEAALLMDAKGFGDWLSQRLDIPGLDAPRPARIRHLFIGTHADLFDDEPRYMRRWPLVIAERDGLVFFGDERLVLVVSASSKELFAYYYPEW